MIELQGKYSDAKIFTDNVEQSAVTQVYELLNQPFIKDSNPRFMPDIHAGKGCVIGTTMYIENDICPNLVGVDINCGLLTVELGNVEIDLEKLDDIAHRNIPSGYHTHKEPIKDFELDLVMDIKNKNRILKSLGTLGGGNHFIEVAKDDEENKYLIIHSGSRNLGKQVADHYQKLAIEEKNRQREIKTEEIISECKENKTEHLIEEKLKELKEESLSTTDSLATLKRNSLYYHQYLHDMEICAIFARENRKTIAEIILQRMFDSKLDDFEWFETVHNYIDIKTNILRKGAVASYEGKKLTIPLNMRDGSLICTGKSNPDWNYSAPHGAGRIMSRGQAKEIITLEDFKESMEGIYSTSVKESTIDESPFAYKDMEEIIRNIGDTAEIIKRVVPIYNFKA